MMDQTTLTLFGRLPREVASPTRWLINNTKDMYKFISFNDGIMDLYTSVYPSNYVIDKIFFDFDYGDVLEDAKKTYVWMLDQGYDVIPIVSGNGERIHLYMITKPKIYGPQAKILLTKATYSIIKSVFGPFRQELHNLKSGKQVQVLRNKDRIIGPDPMVCGDIRRITRIPNTLRPPQNLNYCTYLPPDKFLDMTGTDVIRHMKQKHSYNYTIRFNKAPLLTDFEYDFQDEPDFKDWKPVTRKKITTSNPCLFLEQILRPCLYRHITSIHPSHEARVSATIDLLELDYDPEEILDLYSTLGWEDFQPDLCLKQIKSCMKYTPYSCTKLRHFNIPEVCCVG